MHLAKYIKKQIKTQLPAATGNSIDELRFVLTKPLMRLEIPDTPYLDLASTPFFAAALKSSNYFLEYGSGGSTVLAFQLGKPLISIDSDRKFLNAVRCKLGGGLRNDQRLIPVDIGLTGRWGTPFFKWPTRSRLRKWRNYPNAPWQIMESEVPDLIMIDGRFRVCCALTTIKKMSHVENYMMLIDDYAARPNYHVVERFAELEKMVGRMAVFRKKPFDDTEIDIELDHHLGDWR